MEYFAGFRRILEETAYSIGETAIKPTGSRYRLKYSNLGRGPCPIRNFERVDDYREISDTFFQQFV
jgi:hypothetical protein